ncbi:MAG: tRNA 2-thiouridine(34) synthase MnmA [Patescibacteria group bacterium]
MSRVAMLMSGGVDSSVSAALLKNQGYEVLGFYILGWLGTPDFPCPWQKEEKDAREVANVLGIPFHTINLSKVYEEEVINRFFAGYQAGVTPNPDVLCNREIKFKALWKAIRQFECDYIATGHYARCQQTAISHQLSANGEADSRQPLAESSRIFKAKDQNKDQTYFLWGIEKSILPKIIFPLGELTKPEVRKLAKKYHLPTATKKDSQGICFVGPLKVRQFLASRVKTKPGDVYLVDGRKIATHEGVELYTIGQRLAAGSVDWTGDVPPLFIIAKDLKNNRLIVGTDSQTFDSMLIAGSLNWLEEPKSQTFEALAKIRYRQIDEVITASKFGSKWKINFSKPVRALTTGQSIVFYAPKGQLLGGGIIELVPQQDETVKRLAKTLDSAKV